MTNSIGDLAEADVLFIYGSNTFEAHPLVARSIVKAKDNGAKIIAIDPRRTHTSKMADIHMKLIPGSNIDLMNAIMNVIITEGLTDDEFIKNRTENFDELKEVVSKYTPEEVAKISGIPAETIREAARLYANADKAAIMYCLGVTEYTFGVDNVKSCCNLAMITGNLGKRGAGVNPLRGQNNVQGACDMGALPNVYPGYQKVGEMTSKLEELWGVEGLSPEVGLMGPEMFERMGKGFKYLHIVGEDPMVADADINHVEHALKELDFLVVQDIFLTDTGKLADVVLPAACWAEKDGTFTNTERRVQRIRKAVEAPGEAVPDWVVVKELAQRMGYGDKFAFESASDIFDEMAKVIPQYAGMSFERLGIDGLQWPCKTPDHPGTPFLHEGKFLRPNGLGKICPVEHKDPAEMASEEYPFILTTGRIIFHYNSGTMTRRCESITKEIDENFIEMNIEDANNLGIKAGETVKVSSKRGDVKAIARVSDDIVKGVVYMSFHFNEEPTNKLTNSAYDPVSKTAELKICAVNVEKIE
ncbi:formate dehydrogenase major subunit [Methanococcus voltae]|nr:formate dehydrogenase major subunit [Methanococcus voltae]